MNTVQPIREKTKIKAMAVQLKAIDDKYFILFSIGVNVGLRISDILKLNVYEIYDMDHVTITEKKTQKKKRFLVNTKVKKDIKKYVDDNKMNLEDYLIPSRKHDINGEQKSISRVQAYRVLSQAADLIGIPEIGTHSLRKTFGYHHYQRYHDVAMLMTLFGHSSPRITLQYIGITYDQIDDSMKDFYLL